jgi:hypothetical protein
MTGDSALNVWTPAIRIRMSRANLSNNIIAYVMVSLAGLIPIEMFS